MILHGFFVVVFVADSVFVNGAAVPQKKISNFHTEWCHFRQYKWVYMCLHIMP